MKITHRRNFVDKKIRSHKISLRVSVLKPGKTHLILFGTMANLASLILIDTSLVHYQGIRAR